MPKKKVFIVYATENYKLTQNFVDEFKNMNYNLTVLYDKNAYDNEILDQLKGYANECDLGLILFSPRLMNPKHFSNKNEIPILLDRRSKDEAAILIVPLRDADISKWNAKKQIPFLQVRVGDLPHSKENGNYSSTRNSQFAVYEQIDERDRSTFHKEIKFWIDTVLKNK